MRFSTLSTALLTSLFAFSSSVQAADSTDSLPPIEIAGNKFFYSNNGSQFYIRGIAYQSDVANETAGQTFSDPLADGDSCKRDLAYLQKLQTNVLRVYALNTSLDHTECMNLFSDAGIYIVADLSEPGLSVDRDDPKWTVDLYERYTSVIDDFHNYTNVLGFFAGNEVTNNNTNTDASPFVKAAIRDMKSYMKTNNYRQIPVGYSSNDDSDTRLPMAEFFACGTDEERADFYGINMYEWCGNSNFVESGYQARTEEFANLNIPLFFSEYGCNAVQPRKFTEVATLYSDNMTDVWSGGIVYMYFEEANNYGLVSISDDAVSTLADFNFLSSELAAVTPTIANSASIQANSTQPACPASTGKNWRATNELPPTPNNGVCQCLSPAAACVVDSSVDSKDYGDLFSYLCGQVSCDGISGNGTSGEYGAFSFCDAESQLNFVLNLYYQSNGKEDSACDFSGSASVNKSPSTAKACVAVLSEAGSVGTGSVTASITAQTTSGSGSGSGGSASGTNSASASSSHTSSKSGAASVNASGLKLASGIFASLILATALIM